ncbi:protein of unknown function [Kyrpidia spormannii]|uniref:Uncharacterized protein n=1 Tax=Kyrpidia spormannii TaxID=2055160 RepID=A0ACA8ZCG5_9BACL|nr:protein of unknown function [Kyrpidia spormannii]
MGRGFHCLVRVPPAGFSTRAFAPFRRRIQNAETPRQETGGLKPALTFTSEVYCGPALGKRGRVGRGEFGRSNSSSASYWRPNSRTLHVTRCVPVG